MLSMILDSLSDMIIPPDRASSSTTTMKSSILYLVKKGLPKDLYNDKRLNNLRAICISSSSCSLLSTFIFFYTYFAIHPLRLKFRHKLIFVLMVFDFLKALAILIFPIYSYVNPDNIGKKTADFLGFFTALSVEGGDLAILAFAIHTSLVIFNPRKNGGLYHWRYYYYASTITFPVLMASLAFVSVGYVEQEIWCYLPDDPLWLTLALSYCPRLAIMVVVIVIYSTIYIYIMSQLSKMNKQRKTFDYDKIKLETPPKWYSFKRYIGQSVTTKQQQDQADNGSNSDQQVGNTTDLNFNIQLQLDNSQRLKTRYKVISRQIKTIFLYPATYVLLWIFPFIERGLDFSGYNIYGIRYIVSFIYPLNGFVDLLVYIIRERPWNFTYMKTERSPFAPVETVSSLRYYMRYFPLYGLPQDIIDTYRATKSSKFMKNDELKKNVGESSTVQISPFVLNPNEFLNEVEDSYVLNNGIVKNQLNEETITSTPDNSTKRHMSTDESIDEDDDEMDFLDFLNRGPPT